MKISLNNVQKRWGVILLLLFLCAVKIPPMFTADIQPWDEGLYATRVNSIHINGDFWEQASHSIGRFESGSHPPLFIWIGYFATSVFGTDEVVFKLIPFIFGLLCVLLIVRLGELLYNFETGFLSAMIFSATYLFTVYAKRFQFDIAVAFFILLTFYFTLSYIQKNNKNYLYLGGVAFGLCLMTKSLVGFFIPMILFGFYIIILRKQKVLRFSDLVVLSGIGVLIALPWHIFMVMKYGQEFINVLFGFHIMERATGNIGRNVRPSGVFYYFSILMNNVPFGIIVFYLFLKDIASFKKLDWKKIFLWVWFLTGFVIISLFNTKIETYLIPFIIPAGILLTVFFLGEKKPSSKELFVLSALFILNIFWYLTPTVRNELKSYVMSPSGAGISALVGIAVVTGLYFLSNSFRDRVNLKTVYLYIVVIFFVGANVFHLFSISMFEDGFKLAEIKELSENSGRDKLVYVSSEYEFSPQFTYYFGGMDIGWKGKYDFSMLDLKNGIDPVKGELDTLEKGQYIIIVERDNINTGEYHGTELFIPPGAKLVKKTHGFEMYLN